LNTLFKLLDKLGKYRPEYANGLAMHLPMVLVSLTKLQADERKLAHIFKQNEDELETLITVAEPITDEQLKPYLGQSDKFDNYLAYFRQQISKHGVQQVLSQYCDLLIPGLAASAFHALIRLAYALEVNHDNEIAIALAYWCSEYQPFDLSEKQVELKLEQILDSVVAIGMQHKFAPGIIVNRMDEVAQLLNTQGQAIQPACIDYNQIRRFALKAFYAQDDFTLLHTVTGCHAFSKILPFVSDKQGALRQLWQAIVVAYLSTGLPFEAKPLPEQTVTLDMFSSLKPLALVSNESHKIKLYYSCLCEYLSHGDIGYFWIAKRALVEN